jgi:cytochrome c-type biogenesis protein CcmH/NrfG
MQDEIVARLARQLNTEIATAEARRAERAVLPDSMDLYFQGLARVMKGPTPENTAQARSFYERALALDPDNIRALVGTALVDFYSIADFLSEDRGPRAAAAEAALTKVLSLAPNHAWAQYLLGSIRIHTNRAAEGIAKCEHALVLDRNLADAHVRIGVAKIFTGAARKPKAACLQRCASAHAIRQPILGWPAQVLQSSFSAAMRRRRLGCAGPLRLTQIILWRTSYSLPPARISAR